MINKFGIIKCLSTVFLKFKDYQNSFLKREKYHILNDNIIIQRIDTYYKFSFVVLEEEKKTVYFKIKFDIVSGF